MASCNKEDKIIIDQTQVESTRDIIAPNGFTWESSRNIHFTINVLNSLTPSMIHVISIYDGDPLVDGNLISKGSATTKEGFKCKVYLPNNIVEVYVVGAFPNGSVITEKISITNSNLSTTIGS